MSQVVTRNSEIQFEEILKIFKVFYHRRLSFLAFDDKEERSFSLASVKQYFSRNLTVNLSTGRDLDKSVFTIRVKSLHLIGEIFEFFEFSVV